MILHIRGHCSNHILITKALVCNYMYVESIRAKKVKCRLSGSICNVDKTFMFGKYALESSILCQCVPQFNTGSLASRLPQHLNL